MGQEDKVLAMRKGKEPRAEDQTPTKSTFKGKSGSCNITEAKGGENCKQNVFRPRGRNVLCSWMGQGEKDIAEAGGSPRGCFCSICSLHWIKEEIICTRMFC